jgi:ferritin-like metal-binding protein YciE
MAKSSKTGTAQAAQPVVATDNAPLLKLLTDSIKDLYWAERHLLKALPILQAAATTPELKDTIANHLLETQGHVVRLEEVFGLLGEKVQAKKCDAMEGLSLEGEAVINNTDPGSTARDVGIILAAQKTEHYEIAAYGGLKQLALTLGRTDISEVLDLTLTEEAAADQLLTEVCEKYVVPIATPTQA